MIVLTHHFGSKCAVPCGVGLSPAGPAFRSHGGRFISGTGVAGATAAVSCGDGRSHGTLEARDTVGAD